MSKMSLLTLITMIACIGVGINCKRTEISPAVKEKPQEIIDTAAVLANGNYLILRHDIDPKKLGQVGPGEALIVYQRPAVDGVKEPPEYLVVSKNESVPLLLNKPAKRVEDGNGEVWIDIELAPEVADRFAALTRANQDKSVVCIIGGKAVSKHTIRGPIEGGELKVGCCNLVICEQLLSALSDAVQR